MLKQTLQLSCRISVIKANRKNVRKALKGGFLDALTHNNYQLSALKRKKIEILLRRLQPAYIR